MDIIHRLSTELDLNPTHIANVLTLLKEGATIPFLARYRKERTGGLNEDLIREVDQRFRTYSDLEKRKDVILASIRDQGKLTSGLESRIQAAATRTELEDLYLPYRPKRVTRASKAREAGLEPLARYLVSMRDPGIDPVKETVSYLNPEKGFDTPDTALQGACDILAEEISEDADVRKWLRKLTMHSGYLSAAPRKDFAALKTKFSNYYDFREKVGRIPSHRVLAMLRGEKEKILRLKLELPEDKILPALEKRLIRHPQSPAHSLLRRTVKDALARLLGPATETEIRKEIKEKAEGEAIRVFSENLRELLLAPPAGRRPVLGVDPGFRTGCKVAALDATGKFLEFTTVFPNPPQKALVDSARTLLSLIQKHGIALIAVGNGTAGRETAAFMQETLATLPEEERPVSVMVSEAGASVYSASPLAREEFPEYDATVRGAISIGRRLQDPLSELVKIDPGAIGVGQYQHDVNQIRLKEALDAIVESCVNRIGVDVNLASIELLKHVAGFNRTSASALVSHRDRNGAFRTRAEIQKVKGIGKISYEQAAGFLRIPGAAQPLDDSAVHPERYALIEKMAVAAGAPLERMIGNPHLIRRIRARDFISGDVGLPTIRDLLSEMEKPGRDPRKTFDYARFEEEVKDISDLTVGKILEGTVTNVTNFGAFVDIGVHQDGLVHISQIAEEYVDDPHRFAHVGQVVKVKILSVDLELKRIGLSLREGS